LRQVFDGRLDRIPVSSNKSMLGHTLGASAAIEAALTIEGMQQGVILPTVNHLPDPQLEDVDVVPDTPKRAATAVAMSNAFGFGGTNCCVIFGGV
jgi:3-oxoacyl-[acyl-carrier-protein] synthase II